MNSFLDFSFLVRVNVIIAFRLHSILLESYKDDLAEKQGNDEIQDMFYNLFNVKTVFEKFMTVLKFAAPLSSKLNTKLWDIIGWQEDAEFLSILSYTNPKLFWLDYLYLDLICDNWDIILGYNVSIDDEECITNLQELISIINSDYKLVLQWEKSTIPFLILHLTMLHYNLYYKSIKNSEKSKCIDVFALEDNIIALWMSMEKIFMIDDVTVLDIYKMVFLPLNNYRLCWLLFTTIIRNHEMYSNSVSFQNSIDETHIMMVDNKSKTRFDYESNFIISKLLDINKLKLNKEEYGESELKSFLKEDDWFAVDQLLSINSRNKVRYWLKFMQEVFSNADVKSEPLLKPVMSDDD